CLADVVSLVVWLLMSFALFGMICSSTVGMLCAFTARCVQSGTPKFKGSIVVVSLLAFGASFIGFTKLVGTVYPVTGYLGFVLIIAICITWILSFKKKSVSLDGYEKKAL